MRTGRIYPDAIVRPLRRPWLVLATAVAVVALPTVASGALSAPAPAANTHDLPGLDRRGAGVARHHDDRRVERRRRDASRSGSTRRTRRSTRRTSAVFMDIDSDANQATGDPESLRRRLLPPARPGRDRSCSSGTAPTISVSATQSSLSYSWSSGPTIRINAVGSQQHAKASASTCRRSSGIAFDPYDWRVRLHELQARLRTASSASTRTRSRSRSRRSS